MTSEKELGVGDLMRLYEASPDLILYGNDLLDTERAQYIQEIASLTEDEPLNPLDVVLESLINILTERLSADLLTQSEAVAYCDRAMQEHAIHRITSFVQNDKSFLREIHKKWLGELVSFLEGLKDRRVHRLEEIVFQVSLRFRISASSSMKAILSITK